MRKIKMGDRQYVGTHWAYALQRVVLQEAITKGRNTKKETMVVTTFPLVNRNIVRRLYHRLD